MDQTDIEQSLQLLSIITSGSDTSPDYNLALFEKCVAEIKKAKSA